LTFALLFPSKNKFLSLITRGTTRGGSWGSISPSEKFALPICKVLVFYILEKVVINIHKNVAEELNIEAIIDEFVKIKRKTNFTDELI